MTSVIPVLFNWIVFVPGPRVSATKSPKFVKELKLLSKLKKDLQEALFPM
ncbi:hypothetical protein MS5797_36960 [Klebsiella pneumoniae]|nr:hypothetical protein MS5797_36960 [Klebsiella pneumoniae]